MNLMPLFGNWTGRALGNRRLELRRLVLLIRELIGRGVDIRELEPPPAHCPISWQPSVTAAVFYGTQDFGPSSLSMFRIRPSPGFQWPPGTFRVFFPSLDGSPQYGAMLEPCGRYPLIMFLHGSCPADAPLNYTKWHDLPAELARSGYVVVVPHLPHTGSGSDFPSDIPLVLSIMRWMRTDWGYARVLLPEPATGIVGHSFGALLGAQVALEQQLLAAQGREAIQISAFASLSGAWFNSPSMPWSIQQLQNTPKLFTWGGGASELDVADLRNPGAWNPIPAPKHSAFFPSAEHWDCLLPTRSTCGNSCGNSYGPCH